MQPPRATTPALPLFRLIAAAALVSGLAACGYKGPLYLPPPPPPDESLTAPPTTTALPRADTPAAAVDSTVPDASAPDAFPSPVRAPTPIQ